jgi:cell division protease FtsH
MNLSDHLRDHEFCLRQAARLLGTAVRAVDLGWSAEKLLRRHLRLVDRRGLASDQPFLTFSGGPKGQQLRFGIEQFTLELDGTPVSIAKVVAPECGFGASECYEFWAVPIVHHRRLYRFVRRLERRSLDDRAPIMPEADRRSLWENTIGFLRHGQPLLERFAMPRKRGVALLGEPGNGKTMACRWLLSQCHRHGLQWRSVTVEQYESACQSHELQELFELGGPGIVLFDDLDEAVRDRETVDGGTRRTTFLTELDGLYPRDGVVVLFTSNMRHAELDAAFRRPGRIDLFITLARPDIGLRRRFVTERWQPEIRQSLDIEQVVEVTEGLSFAAMDDVRKRMVLGYLDTGRWDWHAAWEAHLAGHAGSPPRPRIGFNTSAPARPRNQRSPAPANGA